MSFDGQTKKLMIHRHNAFKGHSAMMVSQCNGIIASHTASPEAKETADRIRALAQLLRVQLETRID